MLILIYNFFYSRDDEEVYKFELLVPAKVEMFSLDLSSRKSEPESV